MEMWLIWEDQYHSYPFAKYESTEETVSLAFTLKTEGASLERKDYFKKRSLYCLIHIKKNCNSGSLFHRCEQVYVFSVL